MSMTKRIVCLANSTKFNGRCVAGKELMTDGVGDWIRPVSSAEGGKLLKSHWAFQDGQGPQLLDVLEIVFSEYSPDGYQTENYLIDESIYWERHGRISVSDLPKLCDSVEQLWVNGYNSMKGLNDRIPQWIAAREVDSSLLLIGPTKLSLTVPPLEISKTVRADFGFNGTPYRFVVTDPIVESRYRQQGEGIYPINPRNVFLCISLGEPYKGYAYKLVAGIINLPQE